MKIILQEYFLCAKKSARDQFLKQQIYTLKNAGLFQPKFGSNMDKPKCWVKNVV